MRRRKRNQTYAGVNIWTASCVPFSLWTAPPRPRITSHCSRDRLAGRPWRRDVFHNRCVSFPNIFLLQIFPCNVPQTSRFFPQFSKSFSSLLRILPVTQLCKPQSGGSDVQNYLLDPSYRENLSAIWLPEWKKYISLKKYTPIAGLGAYNSDWTNLSAPC